MSSHRGNLAVSHHPHHLGLILVGPAVGADDGDLVGPDVAEVVVGGVARGGAAGQHAALGVDHLEAIEPGIAADVVDDHVDAAAFAHARLAEVLVDEAADVLVAGVDHVVGAQLLEPQPAALAS
jgi:hypothetical protein